MIENGAEIEAKGPKTERSSLHIVAINGDLEILKYLKEKGAQSETLDKHGNTPLHDCFNLSDISLSIKWH